MVTNITGPLAFQNSPLKLIEQDTSDVGGSLSIGAATRDDFRLYSYVTPIVEGKPEAKISFNGIDLDQEARLVGHYMISIDRIA